MLRPLRPPARCSALLAPLLLWSTTAPVLAAQVAPRPSAEESAAGREIPADDGEARDAARDAQARFERDRVRWLPETDAWGGGQCDERVGRMCLRHDGGGDWYPVLEDARTTAARAALLAELEVAHARAPADGWILGQRVLYLGEAGRWDEAAALARASCAADQGEGACLALEGLALHALGRYAESESAFRRALGLMDAEEARRWSDPEILLDGPGRDWWGAAPRRERPARAALFWALADPLRLVAGNDRLTEHWARWTVARTRAAARNPYGMAWGTDLDRVTVRYGWEIGWERVRPRPLEAGGPPAVVGHHHPESRRLLPGATALRAPAAAGESDWLPDLPRVHTAYAPAYAPILLPGAGQLAVFPRGGRIVVVGAPGLPEDTARHATHGHPGRGRVGERWREGPPQAGLFLLPVDASGATPSLDPGAPLEARRSGGGSGALLVEAPAGRWIALLESWAPAEGRAGRSRLGIDRPASPPDVATLSDLLLLRDVAPEGATLEEAAAGALPGLRVPAGAPVALAWELFGLGYRPETLSYRLTVAPADPGLLRRIGLRLGLVDAREVRLEWSEPGPRRTGPFLRSAALALPGGAGAYRVRLEVHTPGRGPLVRERRIEVVPRAP